MGIKRRLARLLGIRQMMDVKELGRYVQEGMRAGLSQPRSLPGTQSLASAMSEPQAPVQSLCGGDPFISDPCPEWVPCSVRQCEDPLPPRSERCPEAECVAGGFCWRCAYEESTHRCEPKDDTTC